VAAVAVVLAMGLLLVPTSIGSATAADYGPDTCINGFVWRDAYPGDRLRHPLTSRATGPALARTTVERGPFAGQAPASARQGHFTSCGPDENPTKGRSQ
jgi:hypothetical protein